MNFTKIMIVIALGLSNFAQAGTLTGMDNPDRAPGKFFVVLKSDHMTTRKNPVLRSMNDARSHSLEWLAATKAADLEAQTIATKLVQKHPKIKISAVQGASNSPGFIMQASDEDAKAVAAEDDVQEVDADFVIHNIITSTESPASWGLDRIDYGDSSSTKILDNAYSWVLTGSGVNVYVLDSGINISLPEFQGRATNDASFVTDGNTGGWCANNMSGKAADHGTEVASIIGGANYGVAKQVSLHNVRIITCDNSGSGTAIVGGLQWIFNDAWKRRPSRAVINISSEWVPGALYSSNASPSQVAFVNESMYWMMEIETPVFSNSNYTGYVAGINGDFVIAAGNDGNGHDPFDSWPQGINAYNGIYNSGAVSNIVAAANSSFIVGATAYQSDYAWLGGLGSGTSVPASNNIANGLPNIWAPGDRVTTASINSPYYQSAASGTSLAAPYVAGVVALADQALEQGLDPECESNSYPYCVVAAAQALNIVKGLPAGLYNAELSSLIVGNYPSPSSPVTPPPPPPSSPGAPTCGTTATCRSTSAMSYELLDSWMISFN